jgi:hypothetical protein
MNPAENTPDAALASYRDSAHELFTAPPPQVIVARAGRRSRNRVMLAAAAAAAVVLVLGGVVVASRPVDRLGPDVPVDPPPVATTPSASAPAPAPTPTTPSSPSEPARSASPTSKPPRTEASSTPPLDLREAGWNDFVVRLPADRDDKDCPVGRTELTGGEWPESGDQGPGAIVSSYAGGDPVFGDLDGDGRAEAVRYVKCFAAGGDSGDSSGQLIVITARGNQRVGLGYAGPLAASYDDVRVTAGKLVVTVTDRYWDEQQTRTYRWNGSRFVQIDGPTAWPPIK